MTEFNKGDRVLYTGTLDDLRGVQGTVTGSEPYCLYVTWDGGRVFSVNPRSAERIAPKLTFVGPEPEPAEAPAVTTPFGVNGTYVVDSRGNHVATVSAPTTSNTEDGELAGLISDLLNDHFNSAK